MTPRERAAVIQLAIRIAAVSVPAAVIMLYTGMAAGMGIALLAVLGAVILLVRKAVQPDQWFIALPMSALAFLLPARAVMSEASQWEEIGFILLGLVLMVGSWWAGMDD